MILLNHTAQQLKENLKLFSEKIKYYVLFNLITKVKSNSFKRL